MTHSTGSPVAAADPPTTSPPPARQARKRRWWIPLLIVLVLLCGVGAVGDRIAVGIVESQLVPVVEDAAAEHELEASRTSVKLDGFPFLTQVLQREFTGAHVTMEDATLAEVPLRSVAIELRDISVSRDLFTGSAPDEVTAGQVDGTVRIDPKVLAARLPIAELTLEIRGQKVYGTLPVELRGFTGIVSGEISWDVRDGVIRPRINNVTADKEAAPELVDTYVNTELARGYALPELPFGISLTDIEVRGDSIQIRGSGQDALLTS